MLFGIKLTSDGIAIKERCRGDSSCEHYTHVKGVANANAEIDKVANNATPNSTTSQLNVSNARGSEVAGTSASVAVSQVVEEQAWHVNMHGELVKCPAKIRCTLTNDDGTPQVHYIGNLKEDVQKAFEKDLEKAYGATAAHTSNSNKIEEQAQHPNAADLAKMRDPFTEEDLREKNCFFVDIESIDRNTGERYIVKHKVRTDDDGNILATDKIILQGLDSSTQIIYGPPGCGKTASIRSWAEQNEYQVVTLMGSGMDRTDISGLPEAISFETAKGEEERAVGNLMNHWQRQMKMNPRSILFIDETANIPGDVEASLLTVLDERRWPDGTYFPPESLIIMASNNVEHSPEGKEPAFATQGRLAVHVVSQNKTALFDGWEDNFGQGWGATYGLSYKETRELNDEANPVYTISPKERQSETKDWARKTLNFWKSEAGRQYVDQTAAGNTPDAVDNTSYFAYPGFSPYASPRSWDKAQRSLATASLISKAQGKELSTAWRNEILRSTLGNGAMSAYSSWYKTQNTVKLSDIYDDVAEFDYSKLKDDEVTALCREAIREENITQKTYHNMFALFNKLSEHGKEGAAASVLVELNTELNKGSLKEWCEKRGITGAHSIIFQKRFLSTLRETYGLTNKMAASLR